MNGSALLAHWVAPARRRALADTLALAFPLLVAVGVAGWRLLGLVTALILVIMGVALALLIARRRAARFDRNWLIRSLDNSRPELEDSSALLFADDPPRTALEMLQRTRIAGRLDQASPQDMAPGWSRRMLMLFSILGLTLVAAALLWPRQGAGPPALAPSREGLPVRPGVPRLVAQNLRIIPPPYTGLPVRDSAALDTRAPQGSRLEWTLRFDPQATAPALAMVAGPPLALRRDGGNWIASRMLDASFLYRVNPGGRGTTPPLHRIDAIADMPPQVKAVAPMTSLSMVKAGQRSWTPVFAATDDYGVAATARLRVTLAIGEGENVTFSEREIAVSGSGPARDRRFAPPLDFARFGVAAGGDMVVQLIVRDNRSPTPQEVRGPSMILRWPSAKQSESGGMEGMVNTTLPAYFRSQRQIIIDAESLIKQKRALAPARYVARSAAIGGDQQILRGRYSQFLGGEEEGEPDLPTADADGHHDGDGHDHGGAPTQPSAGFGAPEDVLADFGHPHDKSPASSLAPETRAILKQAVDEMWQSERELKQGRPDLALPFAYKALRFIKEVQQATRIFLSRVGPELPPIDATRRMTGKRDGLESRALAVAPVEGDDGPAAAAWRALGDGPDAIRGPIALGALEDWVRRNATRLPDALALIGAIDTPRSDPACQPCRTKLRALLWTAMERPARLARRRPADAIGARYLDSIGGAQ
ncbi:DUF4175 domain-containing protein [Sphingobium sp. CR2-8]|uniref:DUF4175 domain-containing protein n=1 Tax=Sphingobium sp. CR2-8 TaxID=1306534 RepID=UPI002DBBEDDB|nr:DUF4175 domain-containing protein [Sphingobium sp. CR2-8]MEC3911380.1 DUF4175 domain-containing protein [Sphingobium sp. CR2-8]